jgi:hypothetical protein
MVDDLIGDGDSAAGRGVTGIGEKRNLGFRVLGILGLRVRRLAEVCLSELEEV